MFEELFADDFVDHTPQPNMTPNKAGVRKLYSYIRHAFPDFHAEIHWQLADGDWVTTYKTYYGTHEGPLLGVAPTHRKIHFESVDVMRVRNGKVTDHWVMPGALGQLVGLDRGFSYQGAPWGHYDDRRACEVCRTESVIMKSHFELSRVVRGGSSAESSPSTPGFG